MVLLLETMLAFPDKEPLCRRSSAALALGGRFAFTLEEGVPLTEAERARMPDADTVWLTPLDEMLACLERVGLAVRWQDDCSRVAPRGGGVADRRVRRRRDGHRAQIGRQALDELLAAHRLWSEWLATGRVRKIALVAERPAKP